MKSNLNRFFSICGKIQLLITVSRSTFQVIFPAVSALIVFLAIPNIVFAANPDPETLPGILTVPAVDEGIIYFVAWPGTLYAFNEFKNETRLIAPLDPEPSTVDFNSIPSEPPRIISSNIIIRIGGELWALSRVDGHTVWHISYLSESTDNLARRTGNPMPGYFTFGEDMKSSIITLEYESEKWLVRSRRLGDGGLIWEYPLMGEPESWEFIRSNIVVVSDENSESPANGRLTITVLDPSTGQLVRNVSPSNNETFRCAFFPDRILMLTETDDGKFKLTLYALESGDEVNSTTYDAGPFIAGLSSEDKIVFVHSSESNDNPVSQFFLFRNDLLLIRKMDVYSSREDQLFYEPATEGNLFLYGNSVYSLYDGSVVWRKDAQYNIVSHVSDKDRLYFWDGLGGAGAIFCFDMLTGNEIWNSAFNVLPPINLGKNFGGASLVIEDGKLLASSPLGELYRITPEDGAVNPGALKVKLSSGDTQRLAQKGKSKRNIWFPLTMGILAIALISYPVYKNLSRNRKARSTHGDGKRK